MFDFIEFKKIDFTIDEMILLSDTLMYFLTLDIYDFFDIERIKTIMLFVRILNENIIKHLKDRELMNNGK